MKNKKIIIICILVVVLIAIIVAYVFPNKTTNNQSSETTTEILDIRTESTKLNIEYSNDELNGTYSTYTAKITLSDSNIEIDGDGVTKNNNTITITKAGTYYITGSISDGNIVVEAGKNDDVQLVLDNASITSKTTSAINGVKANKITITLASNSVNTVTDSSEYTEFTDTENSEPDATIFSKTDLVINGSGKLVVNSNYKDGIATKDGLKIANTNIEINAEDDGIRGKEYVAIKNSDINITSKGDGIKSTNDGDESLGYVAIQGGTINITSEADGIQAETIINISENPQINITTKGEVSSKTNEQDFMRGGFNSNTTSTTTEDSGSSSKALKAGKEITIENGTFNISSTDDALHSNDIVIINNGTFKISSEDDGIHADTDIVINGGNINISKSYEGIESSYVEINGGTISVVALDDGVNICGGNDSSAMGGRMGQNNFSQVTDTNRKLVINNGDITINAEGDGLDSNGSMYMNGGKVLVIGTTSGGNGALDYDGEFVVTGGELVAYGSTGMWQSPSSNSTQYSLTFSVSGKSGDEVVLKDSSGNTITSLTTEKTYGGIVISNSNIKKGETYTLYVNGTSAGTLTANSTTTSNLSSNGMGGGMMQQGGKGMNF